MDDPETGDQRVRASGHAPVCSGEWLRLGTSVSRPGDVVPLATCPGESVTRHGSVTAPDGLYGSSPAVAATAAAVAHCYDRARLSLLPLRLLWTACSSVSLPSAVSAFSVLCIQLSLPLALLTFISGSSSSRL